MAVDQLIKFVGRLRTVLASPEFAGYTDGDLLQRYVRQRDEAAFEALVRRHGPMVMGVCRRVLHNEHDAEDAFQAAFLVLVRKAATLRSPGMVGNWLYGVAYRTALEARKAAAKRRVKEANVVPQSVSPEDPWAHLRPVLDQELEQLPEKYQAVLVLCDLEGKTRKEAARHLGCPEGTVASRLATARTILAKRLARHGLTISGGALAMTLSRHALACVPSSLVSSTIRAASILAAGQAAATGLIPAKVVALTEGVMKGMLMNKLKTVTAVGMLAALTCLGASLFMPASKAGGQPNQTPENSSANKPKADTPNRKAKDTSKDNVAEKEAARMKGTWKVVTGEIDGQPLSPPEKQAKWEITADKIAWKANKSEALFTFKVDPTRKPTEIDLQSGQQTLKGIYELDGDTLIVCFGKDRPSQFTTTANSKNSLIVLRREKPLPAEPKGEGKKEPAREDFGAVVVADTRPLGSL